MRPMFRKRPTQSLEMTAVDHLLAEEGPSVAIDVAPKDLVVSFVSDEFGKACRPRISVNGENYSFTAKGWSSYAARTFVTLEKDDEATRPLRQQVATSESVLRLLTGTDVAAANSLLWDWHDRVQDASWRLIMREKTKEVRHVATPSYELYQNAEFWGEIKEASVGFKVQNVLVDEDYFSARVVRHINLEGYRNLYSGLELLNSENGSASTRASLILYDLVCTNGLFIDLGTLALFRKIHRHWDRSKVRAEMRESLQLLSESQQSEVGDLVTNLHGKKLTDTVATDFLERYKDEYGASEVFVAKVSEQFAASNLKTAWGLVSSITQTAQDYALGTRRQHEVNAGRFAAQIWRT